ncbi:hypothetical protein Bbelb_200510 [Branchiostoma belcheri]|nr:hypothetical protein Bbelb_200510 [Branchiostoma belcheri]
MTPAGAKRAMATSAPYQTSVSSSHVRYYSTSDVPDEPQDGQWLLFNAAVITGKEYQPTIRFCIWAMRGFFLLREKGDPPPRKKTKEEVYAYGHAVEAMKERVSRGETTARALKQMEVHGKEGSGRAAPPSILRSQLMHAIQVLVKKIFSFINGHVDPFKTLDAEKTIGRFTHIVGTCNIQQYTLQGLLDRDQMSSLCKEEKSKFLKNEGMNIGCIASDQKTPN